MWKRCRNCGDPFPPVPGIWYCCGVCEEEDSTSQDAAILDAQTPREDER